MKLYGLALIIATSSLIAQDASNRKPQQILQVLDGISNDTTQIQQSVNDLQGSIPELQLDLEDRLAICCDRIESRLDTTLVALDTLQQQVVALQQQIASLPEPLSRVITYDHNASGRVELEIIADGPWVADICITRDGYVAVHRDDLFISQTRVDTLDRDYADDACLMIGGEAGQKVE